MKPWIRWPGLLIFLVLAGLSYFLLYLFIDDFVKARIEAAGSDWANAKVELDTAKLSFFPLGLRLKRLQVTDRENPMQNAVEIGEIAFLIDPGAALDRKIHIEEMTLEALRLNTPRTSSGALAPEPEKQSHEAKKKKETEGLQLPALDLPDVKEILEKENLASLKLIEDLREEAKREEAKWKAQIDALPDKAKFKDYEQRVKKLKDAKKGGLSGILGGVQEVASLQKEIKADLDQIRSAQKMLKTDLSQLKGRVQSLPKVPMDDINRLKEKYALSPKGLSNISRMLLGEQIGDWTETAFQAYEKVQPHLAKLSMEGAEADQKPARGKGIDIHFREQGTLPHFLIDKAQVSLQLDAGNFSGDIQHITTQQALTGKPLAFNLSGQALKDFESLRLEGTVNRVDPAQALDTLHIKAQGHRLGNLSLSKSKDFPVEMKNARADFDTTAKIQNGQLDAKLSAQMNAVVFAVGLKEDAPTMARAMADTLAEVKAFGLSAEAKGTLSDYDLKIASDLDQVFKKAIGNQVKAQAAQFEAKLKSAITAKVDEALAKAQGEMKGLDGLLDELGGREALGDKVLKDALKKATGGLKLPF